MPRRAKPSRPTLGALIVMLLLAALYFLLSGTEGDSLPPTEVSTESQSGWYQVLFTDPTGPNAGTLRGGPDSDLARAIDQARYSVDVAVMRLNLWSIRDALVEAHERGVTVRFVTDSDYLSEDEVGDLLASGVAVVGDANDSLMHHKFVVIDMQQVWTGSMNFTVGSAYYDDNNLLRIQSRSMAEDYTREFEEMFEERRFGPLSRSDTPHPLFEMDGSLVEVWFSPDDGVAARIVELLRDAEERIDFMAFSFTLDPIVEVMIEKVRAGVSVRGVMDRGQANNTGSDFDRLRAGGADVRLDSSPGNMHHKVIVIDATIVIAGSYNFSRSAEQFNDENVLVLHNPDLARLYLMEFERVQSIATP